MVEATTGGGAETVEAGGLGVDIKMSPSSTKLDATVMPLGKTSRIA